jgi:TRAP-type C4-dicarboxylate transport system permease small subunit
MEMRLARLSQWLDKFEKGAVTVLLGTMTIVVFLQVFFRFVVKGSLPWSEELSRYVMVWAVFFGASMGAKTGAHIGVEAFVNFFPQKIKRSMIIISAGFTQIFCVLVFVLSLQVVIRIYQMGQVSPAMEIPMYIPYLAVPVGAVLMSIRFLQASVGKWNSESEVQS